MTINVEKIKELIRVPDWKSEKMPFVFLAIFYIQSVLGFWGKGDSFYFSFVLMTIFALSYFAFLFLTNDIIDLEQDLAAGKQKSFKATDKPILWVFSTVLFLLGSGSFFLLGGEITTFNIAVVLIGFLIALFYTAPPLRFKESGILGIIFGSLVLRPLPILMLSALVPGIWSNPGFYMLTVWIEVLSINKIMRHQLDDYDNDTRSNTSSFARDIGRVNAIKIRSILMPLETISLGFACLALSLANIYFLAAFFVYVLYELFAYFISPQRSDEYFKNKKINVFDLSVILMPLAMAFQLGLRDGLFLLPLLIIYWQRRWIKDFLRLAVK